MRIVGVVPNIRHGGPQGRVQPELYVLPDPNDAETSSMRLAMVMRLREGAYLSIDRLKQTAESMGPRVLVGRARPAAAVLSEQVAKPRHRMLLLTMLGVFGFQTTPHDPITLVVVVALLGAAACLAAWWPARRAASIDPVAALRAE
jgi:hypothetical protein